MLATGTRSYRLFDDGLPHIGESIYKLFADRPQFTAALEDAMTMQETSTTLFFRENAYELRTHAIYEGDNPEGVICIFVDITERVEREKERSAKEKLEIELAKERELGEIRRKLMITLSHELRTPLATIRSASDLLNQYNDRLTPDKRQRRLLSIQEQVSHLTRILDDIDMVVRNDNDGFVFKHQPIDMVQFTRQVVYNLSQKHDNPVRVSCAPDAEVIIADERWLHYVLDNLLTNAARYSDPASTIDILVLREANNFVIQVADNGIGIPDNEIKNLFQPFYRAENVKTINGTGLGLVIVRNIVEAMEGTVMLDSKLDTGTVVTVTLPARGV